MGFFQRLFGGPSQGKEQLEAFKAEAKLDRVDIDEDALTAAVTPATTKEVSAESTAEFLALLQTQQEPETS